MARRAPPPPRLSFDRGARGPTRRTEALRRPVRRLHGVDALGVEATQIPAPADLAEADGAG